MTTDPGAIGSLTFPTSNQGQWMDGFSCFQTQSVAGTATLSFNVVLDGTVIATVISTPIIALTLGKLHTHITIGSTTVSVYLEVVLGAPLLTPAFANVAYDPTVTHTFDVQAQWSVGDPGNSLIVQQFNMDTKGFNAQLPP
jgi:hypothetical protein